MYLVSEKDFTVYDRSVTTCCFSFFRQILFALQFVLQQLKQNEAGIIKMAIDVMVKILSLGKVGRLNCVLLGYVIVLLPFPNI